MQLGTGLVLLAVGMAVRFRQTNGTVGRSCVGSCSLAGIAGAGRISEGLCLVPNGSRQRGRRALPFPQEGCVQVCRDRVRGLDDSHRGRTPPADLDCGRPATASITDCGT